MPKRVMAKTVVGTRLTELRNGLGMKQRDLATSIEEMLGENCHLTVGMISSWETGRRGVPLKYNSVLCKIFSCTEAYLIGETNDPKKDIPDDGEDEESILKPIKLQDLNEYDGKPLWIEFTTFEAENGWAIFNASNGLFMFRDGARIIKRIKDVNIYAKLPDYEDGSLKSKRSLDYMQLMRVDKVYILMISPDKSIRNKYNGWYVHNEDRSALISPWSGLVLPYSGLNISYRAYSVGDLLRPYKKVDDLVSE